MNLSCHSVDSLVAEGMCMSSLCKAKTRGYVITVAAYRFSRYIKHDHKTGVGWHSRGRNRREIILSYSIFLWNVRDDKSQRFDRKDASWQWICHYPISFSFFYIFSQFFSLLKFSSIFVKARFILWWKNINGLTE